MSTTPMSANAYELVEVLGACVHNLKHIDVCFPRDQLVVITGVSGSGKSSLAFDTLYAEGQRRYIESFPSYARSFIGHLTRPEVDKINGLSPVIAIEQKTTSRNPRATVGTSTEIYDFLRLLFAKTAEAYSYLSGHTMRKQSAEQIQAHLLTTWIGKPVTLLAPVVKGRKGHYRELFQQISRKGFTKVRIDNKIKEIVPNLLLDRYTPHTIEIVIDHFTVRLEEQAHIQQALHTALQQGQGTALLQDQEGNIHYISQRLMDPETGLAYDEPSPHTFSFNSPYGACPTCNGLGEVTHVKLATLIPDPTHSIRQGGIAPLGPETDTFIFKQITALLKRYQVKITDPIQSLPAPVLDAILYGDGHEVAVDSVKQTGKSWYTRFDGVIAFLARKQEKGNYTLEPFEHTTRCSDCQGTRLKKSALYFKLAGKNIAELAQMDLQQLYNWFQQLAAQLSPRQQYIAQNLIKEICKRIHFLLDVGLYYLPLNRPVKALSGGEAQRIRLATQLGTQLVGVLYILDEPSIGLHQRDNIRLIKALQGLRDLGNSVLVVEHDQDIMTHADYLIEMGPGAGIHGGAVVAAGPLPHFLQQSSVTADFLTQKRQINIPQHRRTGHNQYLTITGCTGNNLKNITVHIPLGTMICVTGVSGSGKSTLFHDTLSALLQQYLYKSQQTPLPYQTIEGLEHLDKVVEVDQTPIGRTPRSNPATYTGIFTEIRTLFTRLPEAKIRGYKPGRFSFNVKGGRCDACEGAGVKRIEMNFLPDVHVSCETCKGKRYNRETLDVHYKGKSITAVLDMTIHQAIPFFQSHPRILAPLQTLAEIGLGYITLGQHATTLSGGEAQRIKLATELAKKDTGNTLYMLDEPTTGLHFQDIEYLLQVLQKLVTRGNTVLIIEHNLDVIKVADHIIDMGPEGGDQGGEIIVAGTPETVAQHPQSYTGHFLKKILYPE